MVYDSNIILEVKDKWEQILNTEIPHDIVENGFKAITQLKEGPYHKYFQFKLLQKEQLPIQNCTL